MLFGSKKFSSGLTFTNDLKNAKIAKFNLRGKLTHFWYFNFISKFNYSDPNDSEVRVSQVSPGFDLNKIIFSMFPLTHIF